METYKNFKAFKEAYLRRLKARIKPLVFELDVKEGPTAINSTLSYQGEPLVYTQIGFWPEYHRLFFHIDAEDDPTGVNPAFVPTGVKIFKQLSSPEVLLEEEGIKSSGYYLEEYVIDVAQVLHNMVKGCGGEVEVKDSCVVLRYKSWEVEIYPEAVQGSFGYHPKAVTFLQVGRAKAGLEEIGGELAYIKHLFKKLGINP